MRTQLTTRIIFAILALAFWVPPSFADGEEIAPRVDSVSFKRGGGDSLLIDFGLQGDISKEIVETLDSGLSVRITYRARVVRSASFFLGGVISDREFDRLLEKDNLTNTYRVSDDDGGKVREFETLAQALELMRTVENFNVVPLTSILPDQNYQLELQVKLEEFRLPFLLHRFLPFTGLWDETTPWLVLPVPKNISQTR